MMLLHTCAKGIVAMITIEGIAKIVGVSHSTVSRALSGSSLVNETTRGRILQVAEQYGYKPNRIAQSLARKSTMTLGLVVPEVLNPYYPELIDHFVRQAKEASYTTVLSLSGVNQEDEEKCLEHLYGQRVDGIAIVAGVHGLLAREAALRLWRNGTPIVVLGWAEGIDELDAVYGEDAKGAAMMTRHLIGLGHRRIVMVAPDCDFVPRDRCYGFNAALAAAGLDTENALISGVNTIDKLNRVLDKLLDQRERPTALFAYQDILAAHILQHLHERGVAMPQDLAVVGFDNLGLSSYVVPSLTTVDQRLQERTRGALRLLFRRIGQQSASNDPEHVVIRPEIVVRQSCGASNRISPSY